jgi:hypothetical protein
MHISYVVIGGILLILGRKYAWSFTVGLVFYLFMQVTAKGLFDFPDLLILMIGIVLAVSGGLLAAVLHRVTEPITGFLAAGYLLTLLAGVLNWFPAQSWMPFAAGGLLGLVMILGATDWALTVLSSLMGALMISRSSSISSSWMTAAFLGITLAGVVIQTLIMVITRAGTPTGDELLTEEEIARRAELRESMR